MATLYNCSGCKKEFSVEVDDVFTQGKDGKEKYCRQCNKKYPLLNENRTYIFQVFDRLKWDFTDEIRAIVYKEGPVDHEKLKTIKEQLEAKVNKIAKELGLKEDNTKKVANTVPSDAESLKSRVGS